MRYFLPTFLLAASLPLAFVMVGAWNKGGGDLVLAHLSGAMILAALFAAPFALVALVIGTYRDVRREQHEQAELAQEETRQALAEQREFQEEQRRLGRLQAEWLERQLREGGPPDPEPDPAPEPEAERKSADVYVINGGKE